MAKFSKLNTYAALTLCAFLSPGCNNSPKSTVSYDNAPLPSDSITESATIISDTVRIETSPIHSSNAGIRIVAKKQDYGIQTIEYRYEFKAGAEPNKGTIGETATLCDVNFDGFNDILINIGRYGNQNTQHYDCYVWNETEQKFKSAPSFKKIDNPVIDSEENCIFSSVRSSAAEHIYQKWEYFNNSFRLTAQLIQQFDAFGKQTVYSESLYETKEVHRGVARDKISPFWSSIIMD